MTRSGSLWRNIRRTILLLMVLMMVAALVPAAAGGDGMIPGAEEAERITEPFRSRVWKAARFGNGVLAVMSGNKVGYFEDSGLVFEWDHETTEEDFFFDVSQSYPEAEYPVCARLGNEIVSFREDLSMHTEAPDVFAVGISGEGVYACSLSPYGTLKYWSPYMSGVIAMDVQEAAARGGLILFRDGEGVKAVDADAYAIGKRTSDFLVHHPLPTVKIGDGALGDYAAEAFGEDPQPEEQRMAAFREKYGIDFSRWGKVKHSVTIGDFAGFSGTTLNYVLERMDLPEDNWADPLVFSHISFYGYDGYFSVYAANDVEIDHVCWNSYDTSPETVAAIRAEVAGRCPQGTNQSDIYEDDEIFMVGYQTILSDLRDGHITAYNMRKYGSESIPEDCAECWAGTWILQDDPASMVEITGGSSNLMHMRIDFSFRPEACEIDFTAYDYDRVGFSGAEGNPEGEMVLDPNHDGWLCMDLTVPEEDDNYALFREKTFVFVLEGR